MAIRDRIAPRGWDSEPGYYASIGRGWCDFDSGSGESEEGVGKTKRELEKEKRELERSKWENESRKRLQCEAELECLQPDVEMPMFPLLEGSEQSAPTTVALAAESSAAEVITGTRVFPDAAAPDASVERAARKLGSVAGTSNKICGERRASTGILFPLEVRYHNNSSSNDNNTSNYGPWWDTTCVIALLRPFDPRKECQRDTRRERAVLVVDLLSDRGKSWGRMQHGG